MKITEKVNRVYGKGTLCHSCEGRNPGNELDSRFHGNDINAIGIKY